MTGRRFTARTARTSKPKKAVRSSRLTVRFRGKDDAPLSIALLKQGLYDLIRKLEPYRSGYRVKGVALYLTVVNENGEEVSLDATGVWNLWPSRSAADELDNCGGPVPDKHHDRNTGQGDRPAH
jgi:hypothetical protein